MPNVKKVIVPTFFDLTFELKREMEIAAIKFQIDLNIIIAIAKTESGYNPLAQRFEAAYPYLYSVRELADLVGCTKDTMTAAQKTSYGLMQPMGALCYELGFREWPARLFDVKVNLNYACKYIRQILDKGYTDPCDIYAAYNAGSVRKSDNGNYVNQSNVRRFKINYDEIDLAV